MQLLNKLAWKKNTKYEKSNAEKHIFDLLIERTDLHDTQTQFLKNFLFMIHYLPISRGAPLEGSHAKP